MSGACRHCLSEHGKSVCKAQFSPDSVRLYTASHDRFIRQWDVDSGKLLKKTDPHGSFLAGGVSISLSPDGGCVASAGGRTFRIWSTTSWRVLHEERLHVSLLNHPHDVCYSPDGRRLFVCCGKEIFICDAEHWELPAELFSIHNACGAGVTISPDGALVATTFFGPLQLWETATRKSVPLRGVPPSIFYHTAFLSDRLLLVTANKEIRLMDVAHSAIVAVTRLREPVCSSLAVTPTARMAAVGYEDGEIEILEICD